MSLVLVTWSSIEEQNARFSVTTGRIQDMPGIFQNESDTVRPLPLRHPSGCHLPTTLTSHTLDEKFQVLGRQLFLDPRNVAVVSFQQQRVCEIQLLQRFLYLSETPCKSPAEDAEFGTVQVSQQLVKLPDIQHHVDAELGTSQVSQKLCELPHAPPVQVFAVRLVETFR
ncbi:hypothetical protein TNCV_4844711 [Trichonephila clavipes]|uniref:Uncharacterized protein n=1 Tax=Trichonephila clavipes TaxID=2585209 RepID=A0A8X6WJE8_TRICX|nr:hypothetical protein TNCV_4844711 [Trichonephila clavipes]